MTRSKHYFPETHQVVIMEKRITVLSHLIKICIAKTNLGCCHTNYKWVLISYKVPKSASPERRRLHLTRWTLSLLPTSDTRPNTQQSVQIAVKQALFSTERGGRWILPKIYSIQTLARHLLTNRGVHQLRSH